jgi:pyruvate formate lyase activating enzyme
MIFDIQRFSIHDGRGIRTIVFFKGCPLRCAWCENPESQSYESELLYDPGRCIGCLDCTKVAKNGEISVHEGKIHIHRNKIKNPEVYRDVCPAAALRVVGTEKSVADILREIEKDLPFYRHSGGGVTVSGGEPYAQPRLLLDLLKALKQQEIDTAVETSLQARWADIETSLPYVDTFLADLKHTNPQMMRKHTGGDLSRIMKNFRELEKHRANVVVRVPVTPGFNDSLEEISRIVDFTASLTNVRKIDFLPFHNLGMSKYELIGKEYRFVKEMPDWDGRLDRYVSLAGEKGLTAVIGG